MCGVLNPEAVETTVFTILSTSSQPLAEVSSKLTVFSSSCTKRNNFLAHAGKTQHQRLSERKPTRALDIVLHFTTGEEAVSSSSPSTHTEHTRMQVDRLRWPMNLPDTELSTYAVRAQTLAVQTM